MKSEEQFIIDLAKVLQLNGVPAQRLEDTMHHVCLKLNTKADFYTSPSSIFISFPEKEGERTYLEKISGPDLNLEILHELDVITKELIAGKVSLEQASNKLKSIEKLPQRYNKWTNILFFGISTASAACLFNGGYAAIITSGVIGLLIGILLEIVNFKPALGRLFIFVAATLAFIVSKGAVTIFGDYSVDVALITGLIILIPGFSFTQSIAELANGHPVSGTSRMSNAMVTFIMIAFGIGLGSKIMDFAEITPAQFKMPEMPSWIKLIALIAVPAGFVVLFKAIPKHFIWMLIACSVSYYSLTYFSNFNLDELSVFFSALTLGVVCNGISRITDNPVSLMLVPGIILLVPGSVGFKSVAYLLNEETLSGIDNAFSTIITAVALTAGLLFSNTIIKPKRAL